MERRVLLAIFLAFIVLYAWQALFVKPVPKPAAGTTTSSTSPGRGATPATPPNGGASAPVAATNVPPAAPSTAAAVVSEPAERDVRVETRDVIAVFTNRGA